MWERGGRRKHTQVRVKKKKGNSFHHVGENPQFKNKKGKKEKKILYI